MELISRLRQWFSGRPPNPLANPDVWYEGGDGATPEGAVVVRGAESDIEGTAATFAWMFDRFGPKDEGWQLRTHSSGRFGARHIDTFDVALRDGSRQCIYFDVTESFGRPFRPDRVAKAP